MENSSKALIIAGAVLTSILLLATGVQVYNSTGKGSADNAKQASEKMWDGVDLGMGLAGGSATIGELPTGWEITEKPAGWTSDKVTAIKEKATGKIVALPDGYSISEVEDEQTIEGGLVITDGTNEFVWIPVTTDFTKTYTGQTYYSEPKELTDEIYDWYDVIIFETTDRQDTLDGLYGEGYYNYPETAEEKANVNNTFAYEAHYTEMVDSVNKYDGFYIGRFETTIDGNNIGSQEGKTVLTANATLKEGSSSVSLDEDGKNDPFYYRWWGLYAAQRNSNVAGNGIVVQSNMIWGQQWDAMITYFGSKDYSETPVETLVTSGKQNAGQAKYTYKSETISDEICNIYDLRGNTYDWTAQASYTYGRSLRGRLLRPQYLSSVLALYPRSKRRIRHLWFAPSTLYKITSILYKYQVA